LLTPFHALDQDLLRQVAGVVFDYTFHGNPRRLGGPIHEKVVEFGLARFKKVTGDKDITADEPLALLASAHYFNTATPWTKEHFLLEGMKSSDGATRGVAFEKFGAYLLGMAFKSPRHLSNIFQFIGPTQL
jgi:hypothetical protein